MPEIGSIPVSPVTWLEVPFQVSPVTHRIRLHATIVRSYAYYPFALLTKVTTTSLTFGSDSAAAKGAVILVLRLY
jgi:hypothetical protein